jgi:hypothetical protein
LARRRGSATASAMAAGGTASAAGGRTTKENGVWLGFSCPVGRARRGRGDGKSQGTLGRPSGRGCMRGMRAAAACVGAWPGGPATGSRTRAWARRSGPRVGRREPGRAGPQRRRRCVRTPEERADDAWRAVTSAPCSIPLTLLRNCRTPKSAN